MIRPSGPKTTTAAPRIAPNLSARFTRLPLRPSCARFHIHPLRAALSGLGTPCRSKSVLALESSLPLLHEFKPFSLLEPAEEIRIHIERLQGFPELLRQRSCRGGSFDVVPQW